MAVGETLDQFSSGSAYDASTGGSYVDFGGTFFVAMPDTALTIPQATFQCGLPGGYDGGDITASVWFQMATDTTPTNVLQILTDFASMAGQNILLPTYVGLAIGQANIPAIAQSFAIQSVFTAANIAANLTVGDPFLFRITRNNFAAPNAVGNARLFFVELRET